MNNEIAQIYVNVTHLTLSEAQNKANKLLEDRKQFKYVKASMPLQTAYRLPSILLEFFSMYESVETIAGESYLSRNLIGASEFQHGFVRIGTDVDATEIAIRLNEDFVYEIDGSESDEADFLASRLPSIYHWIIVTSEVLYGLG